VLIDTQTHKTIDVFYITARGGKVGAETRQGLEEALRKACETAG
jgi:hypothetical protein